VASFRPARLFVLGRGAQAHFWSRNYEATSYEPVSKLWLQLQHASFPVSL